MSMTIEEVEGKIDELERKERAARDDFDREMNHLQAVYDMLSTVKESEVAKVKRNIQNLQIIINEK